MRRVIVHLIRGEAKKTHEAITMDLVERFGTFPLYERIAPHLTLKRWFELDGEKLEQVYMALEEFALQHRQAPFQLKGYGHFGTEVIYMDVLPSEEVLMNIRNLMNTLRSVKDLAFDEFDEVENDLHATLAMKSMGEFDYDMVWNYIHTVPQPNFNLWFDNLAVLVRTQEKWEVERVWELKP